MSPQAFPFPTSSTKSGYFSDLGQPDVQHWSVLEVGARRSFRLIVEKVTALRPQGIWLCSDDSIEVDGRKRPQQILIFHDAPHEVAVTCESSNGLMHLYNVWEVNGERRSQMRMSGMKVEPIPHGLRYRCTDTGPEPDFERFVFSLIWV